MSNKYKKSAGSETRSFGGLSAFLGVLALLRYAFESDRNPRHFLEIQAGQSVGLNLYFNPPTVHPQCQSGYAHKAAAYPLGALRFCVLRRFWPYIRGRDGPG